MPDELTPAHFDLSRVGQLLTYQYAALQTLNAQVNIRFANENPSLSTETDAVLAYRSPGRLYLRAYNRYIPQLFLLVVNGDRFWFYVPGESLVVTGTRDDLTHARTFDLEVNGFDLLNGLLSKPLATGSTKEKGREKNYFAVNDYTSESADQPSLLKRQIWIRTDTLDVEREWHYTEEGVRYLEIERSQFYDLKGWRLPKFVTLMRPRDQKTLVLMFWDTQVNVPVKDSLFTFEPPAGVRVEKL